MDKTRIVVQLMLSPDFRIHCDTTQRSDLVAATAQAVANNMNCRLTSSEDYNEGVVRVDPDRINVGVDQLGSESSLNHLIYCSIEAVGYYDRMTNIRTRLAAIKQAIAEAAGIDPELVTICFHPTEERHWA